MGCQSKNARKGTTWTARREQRKDLTTLSGWLRVCSFSTDSDCIQKPPAVPREASKSAGMWAILKGPIWGVFLIGHPPKILVSLQLQNPQTIHDKARNPFCHGAKAPQPIPAGPFGTTGKSQKLRCPSGNQTRVNPLESKGQSLVDLPAKSLTFCWLKGIKGNPKS